ncbi:efflux RND transporter periplasmic adaptor subunit [Burkholderia contaminans]|uniref:efflux RND transporter periplasmic adaptor subunit n=2 Tax=Burkholderia contaminans TaxID=488447 RepID=UPI003115C525
MHSRSMPQAGRLVLCALVSATLLSACHPSAAPVADVPRPVKVEVAGGAGQAHADTFVATLRARQRTDLGFESSGRVVAMLADVGDRVRAGQVLARLDESPARWRLDKATADRAAAAATLAERRTHLRQQEELARDGIISAPALQAAQASHQQAASQLGVAEAAVANARRDLAFTRITAPFDGEIVARQVQPFVDVAAGQSVLQMEAGRALEAVVMLPDTIAATLSPGAEAHAVNGTDRVTLTMERLSGRSDNGSLVQAIFRVQGTPSGLRSGGVLPVALPRGEAHDITLPAAAVMAGTEAGRGSVFVIDGASHTLKRRAIRTDGHLLPGGRVAVTQGLRAGEQVVVAGTAVLNEGQSVVTYRAQTILQGARS